MMENVCYFNTMLVKSQVCLPVLVLKCKCFIYVHQCHWPGLGLVFDVNFCIDK